MREEKLSPRDGKHKNTRSIARGIYTKKMKLDRMRCVLSSH